MKTININGNIATDRIIRESCKEAGLLGSPIEDIFKYLVQWFPRKGIEPPELKAVEIAKKYTSPSMHPYKIEELAQAIEAYRTADPLNKQWTLYKEQLQDREGDLEKTMQQLKQKLDELNQPEPPTLRPMSEVKFGGAIFLLENENNIKSWQDGFNDDMFQEAVTLDQGGSFKQSNDYKGTYGQILGWLPLLPDANDIKL